MLLELNHTRLLLLLMMAAGCLVHAERNCPSACDDKYMSTLNKAQLPSSSQFLSGHFAVFLAPIGGSGANDLHPATPADVLGPFHLPPEDVPDKFPPRTQACVPNPVCESCENHPGYDGGIPIELTGTVQSTLDGSNITTADVDIWTADPGGAYWKEDDIWSSGGGRRLQDKHHYNCRAHTDNDHSFGFSSYLPGYYKAGNAYRPRHIHLRAKAPGYQTIVTQLYFHGSLFLGDADIGCCNSGNANLIMNMKLRHKLKPNWSENFSLENVAQYVPGSTTTSVTPTKDSTVASATPSATPTSLTETSESHTTSREARSNSASSMLLSSQLLSLSFVLRALLF